MQPAEEAWGIVQTLAQDIGAGIGVFRVRRSRLAPPLDRRAFLHEGSRPLLGILSVEHWGSKLQLQAQGEKGDCPERH